MSNKLECRLPPINTLALDFPLSMPSQYQHTAPQHFHGLSSPQMAAHGYSNVFGNPSQGAISAPTVQNTGHNMRFNLGPNMPLNLPPQASVPAPATAHAPVSGSSSGLAEYTLSRPSSMSSTGYNTPLPLGNGLAAYSASGAISGKHISTSPAPAMLLQQPSPSSSRRSSSNSPLHHVSMSPKSSIAVPSEPSVYAVATEASKNSASVPETKRRKKRQCPECHLFFSNLATHKSTHLNPTARPHVCDVCNRGFARPNDLFRHHKCHWKETGANNGQFKCPFKTSMASSQCSHSSGIFSRCDTYKNHLKAIHFDYPGGTRKSERATSSGRCGSCQKQFSNVEEWLTTHVDTHSCEYMK